MNNFSEISRIGHRTGFIELSPFYQAIRDQPELAVFFFRGSAKDGFTIEDVNEVGAAIANAPPMGLVGCEPHQCLSPDVADRLVDKLGQCVARNGTIFYEDALHSDEAHAPFRISLIPVTQGTDTTRQVIVVARDSTDKVLATQLQERRRIAEELHDSTGQHLTALGLALATIAASESGAESNVRSALEDARASLAEANREIRTLSYLLHPPVMESHGLEKALHLFATGFAKRAGLEMKVEIEPGAGRLPDEIALTLFRICQEALTNAHRHANAQRMLVALFADAGKVSLRIEDDGIGLHDVHQPLGVGLSSMRERVTRLGGSIELVQRDKGTCLIAVVPRPIIPLTQQTEARV